MTKHEVYRKQCEDRGYIKDDELEGGVKICGVNRDMECKEGCCALSSEYFGGDKQVGWHVERALDNTGLTEQFKEEMVVP
jgi:hypothetical protein